MIDIKRLLGENIKRLRKDKNLTQGQLAELSNCGLNHIANVEIGKKFPSPELISQIAESLQVPPSELFRTADSMTVETVLDEILSIIESQNTDTREMLKQLIEKKKKKH